MSDPVRSLRRPFQYVAESCRRVDDRARPGLDGTISALYYYVPKIDGLPVWRIGPRD